MENILNSYLHDRDEQSRCMWPAEDKVSLMSDSRMVLSCPSPTLIDYLIILIIV